MPESPRVQWRLNHVYKREPGVVIFERTGTHADLFE